MDLKFVRTTCPYCGCGCEMLLEVMDGTLLGTLPSKTNPMNQGKLCIKGWNAMNSSTAPTDSPSHSCARTENSRRSPGTRHSILPLPGSKR